MNKLKELIEQLRNLDPNDPGRWPLSVRVGTIVLLFVIAASAGYWYFVWKAKRPELLEARAQETELWNTLEAKARKAANLQAYKDQLAEMEKSFGAMLRQLPDKTEVPNLLVDISQTGLAAGLEEKLFQPQNEIRQDFYAELPISISLTGTYHEMGNFASGIAALPRIVTLHDIEIALPGREGRGASQGGASQGASPGDLAINVTAKTYRYLDEEEQAAEADAARKEKSKDKPKGKPKGGKPDGMEG